MMIFVNRPTMANALPQEHASITSAYRSDFERLKSVGNETSDAQHGILWHLSALEKRNCEIAPERS